MSHMCDHRACIQAAGGDEEGARGARSARSNHRNNDNDNNNNNNDNDNDNDNNEILTQMMVLNTKS